MSDALFFLLDSKAEPRGTNMIEPNKYAWLMLAMGQPEDDVSLFLH